MARVHQIQTNASAHRKKATEHRINQVEKRPQNSNLLSAQEVNERSAKARKNKITGLISIELALWMYPAQGGVAKKVASFDSFQNFQ
jgi:hypothetical protein